jgi:hypothetical protein
MKKTTKKLSLNQETIRKIAGNGLRGIRGGADTNLPGASNAASCYRDDVCGTSVPCGHGGGGGGGGGTSGGVSVFTCFIAGCETIQSQ